MEMAMADTVFSGNREMGQEADILADTHHIAGALLHPRLCSQTQTVK